MDKQVALNAFNDHFLEFIDDIKRAFPNCKDVRIAHSALHTIKATSPRLICNIWKKAVLTHYRSSIEKGDLDYFATKDYSGDFSSSMQFIVSKLDKFRKPLATLESTEKHKVVTYLRNLTKLNDLYFNNSSV